MSSENGVVSTYPNFFIESELLVIKGKTVNGHRLKLPSVMGHSAIITRVECEDDPTLEKKKEKKKKKQFRIRPYKRLIFYIDI